MVAGFGVSGFAATDSLTHPRCVGDRARRVRGGDRQERATLLEILGARCASVRAPPRPARRRRRGGHVARAGPRARRCSRRPPPRGIPVWGEVELAWRLRDPEREAPWLAVTGTNGKTTTVQMLEAMLRSAGLRTVACGNVGLPMVEAVMDPDGVRRAGGRAVQLPAALASSVRRPVGSGAQRAPRTTSTGTRTSTAYAADKGRIYPASERACVYNVADPVTGRAGPRSRRAGGRTARSGSRSARPASGCSGVVDDVLGDRAFVAERQTCAAELCRSRPGEAGTALRRQRARGGRAGPVARRARRRPSATALRGFRPDGHRIAEVGTYDGVTWIDDSKATNPPAALASLQAYDPVVWVAGGLAKGARFDDLVRQGARAAARRGADRSRRGHDRGRRLRDTRRMFR